MAGERLRGLLAQELARGDTTAHDMQAEDLGGLPGALEIAADLATKENAGSRKYIRPERIGEISARILKTLDECLKDKDE